MKAPRYSTLGMPSTYSTLHPSWPPSLVECATVSGNRNYSEPKVGTITAAHGSRDPLLHFPRIATWFHHLAVFLRVKIPGASRERCPQSQLDVEPSRQGGTRRGPVTWTGAQIGNPSSWERLWNRWGAERASERRALSEIWINPATAGTSWRSC